jgi:hypothetical protein
LTTIDDLGQELTAMTEVGASMLFGTVCDDGAPRAARAWGVRADPSSGHLRIAVTADDAIVVGNLTNVASPSVTFTAADVRTFRSVQIKGRVVLVEPPTSDDRAIVDEQTHRFFVAVMEVDRTPLEGLRCMLPHDVVMVEMSVEGLFDQTPGPAAGSALRST